MTVSINGVYSPTFKSGVLIKETLSPDNETVNRGYYAATTLSAVDAELATGNIKNGITIFGKVGSADVRDISDATAVEAEVLSPETFYAVSGGIRTGTMATRTLSPDSENVLAGYYAATTLSAVDVHLATANIKGGITIFGFAGKAEVVDTTTGVGAVAGDIKDGKVGFINGSQITGTMPTVALNPALNEYPAGYHAGAASLTAVDAQLVTGSIKYGITIFGVAGHTNVRDVSDANALVGEVKSGRTFYAVGGARKTGTMPTVAITAANDNYPAGYHVGNAGGLDAIDTDLTGANIKYGKTIFGKVGSTNVRDTTDANAAVGEVKSGRTFYAGGGAKKTGTMATVAITAANDNYPAGYHAGNVGGLDAIDTNLAPGNIKSGVTIFGKVGIVTPGAYPALTETYFRIHPGTGTMGYPDKVNDGDTSDNPTADAVDEYTEIDLGGAFKLTQFRQYGMSSQVGDGRWKIQYYDLADSTWKDWVTDIPTRTLKSWSNWDSSGGEVNTNKIKLICTAVDTGTEPDLSWMAELEVKY